MMRNVIGAVLVAVFLVSAGPVEAHHSFAAFDRSRQLEVTGTIKVWEWTNPHSWLIITVDKNEGTEYSFEGFSPTQLQRYGITRNKFKVGDKVVVKYFPRKDNGNSGQFVSVDPAPAATP